MKKNGLFFWTILWISSVAFAQQSPTAYVFEFQDRWTKSLGASELLEKAGFQVSPLPLDQSPFHMTVDMIFLGSYVSESPDYKAYMEKYAADLFNYVDKGHLLVQMVQASRTEAVPPFLPSTHGALRGYQEFEKECVFSPQNHLIRGMAMTGNTLRYSAQALVKEAFLDQGGFAVILSCDPYAQYPLLMEGAYGQGRIILSSLVWDKIQFGRFGTPDQPLEDLRAMFFQNLAKHALAVRERKTEAVQVSPPPRKVPDFVPGGWTMILLPDTQIYSLRFPGLYLTQTAWILQNRDPLNIQFVLQLGDITNNSTQLEWEHARMALSLMDGKVPYAFCPGNHDYGPSGDASVRQTRLNEFLPCEKYKNTPTFGGTMEPNRMENSYHFFEAGGRQWIVIALEWAPRDETVDWANSIMAQHPDCCGILITHAYMNNNDLRYDHLDKEHPQNYNPHDYSTPGSKNDGEELWNKLVRKHNFVFVFNGHVLGDGEGYREDKNDAGRTVHQMLANYQMRKLGGEAYLRRLEFNPDGKTVQVKTYSPLYDKYLLEPGQQRTITLDEMPSAAK